MRSMQQQERVRLRYWAVPVLVVIVCGLYVGLRLNIGWWPHDEGAAAQSAERVLQGDLPHRDYIELYTGALSYIHAAAFRVFGVRLTTLRLALFAAFLCWVPAVYGIARRFCGQVMSGAIVLVAVAWSVPNYSASMPTWYNLFLATAGILALFGYADSDRPAWLVLAGLLGGLSMLIKVVGLFYVAGALLYLLYHEGSVSDRAPQGGFGRWAYNLVVVLGAGVLLAAVLLLISRSPGSGEFVHLVLPVGAVAVLTILSVWKSSGGDPGSRVQRLVGRSALFLVGAALPVAAYSVYFGLQGGLPDLVAGVFVRPALRFESANSASPNPYLLIFTLAFVVLFGWELVRRPIRRWPHRITASALLTALIVVSWYHRPFRWLVWAAVHGSVPVVIVAGCAAMLRSDVEPARRRLLMVVLCITATFNLVRFPFDGSIYFFYVAPLAVLSLTAAAASGIRQSSGKGAAGVPIAFFLLFAVLCLHPDPHTYHGGGRVARLAIPRGGLLVAPEDSATYATVVRLLEDRASGPYVLAGPDAPEVYFLAGKRNPTKTLFEFFGDPMEPDEIESLVERFAIDAVVVNREPDFSGPFPARVRRTLEREFADAEGAGRFEVRWRP